jgi:ketosteroid isomerase-like protein
VSEDIAAALLSANEAFYDAFDTADLDAMRAIWATECDVVCLHPGAAPIFGREAVLQSWVDILGAPVRPVIQCVDARAIVLGQSGMVVCREVLRGGHLAATNIFVKESGVWRIVHHQAGPVSPGR